MSRRNLIVLSLVLLLTVLCLPALLVRDFHMPWTEAAGNNTVGMSLGLDLSGGIHVVYEANLSDIGEEDPAAAMQGIIDIIQKRVNAYGVSEPVIQKQGDDRISIQLPGIRDMEAAIGLIGSTAQLDFREVLTNAAGGKAAYVLYDLDLSAEERSRLSGNLTSAFDEFSSIATFGGDAANIALVFSDPVPQQDVESELADLGYGNVTVGMFGQPSYWEPESFPTETDNRLWVPAMAEDSSGKTVHLTGKYLLRNAVVTLDQTTNEPQVLFEFNDEGADLFQQITSRIIGQPLGIFLDDKLVSWPTVQSAIGKSGRITGLSRSNAIELAILLNAGALPVPLGHWEGTTFVAGPAVQDEVDPTLGADSLRKSLIAGAVGLVLVLAFMVFYYRLPGALAACALLIYGILVLTAFKLIPVTLTLAGIAAFILSIGMAVDANVLIFERLKEELRAGRTLGGAIETGFSRAWTAIRDSNVTTLIICGILYWMGSNFAEPRVQGFALTLAIGVALSMFTAIVVTRTFLRLFVGTKLASRLNLFGAGKTEQAPVSEETA